MIILSVIGILCILYSVFWVDKLKFFVLLVGMSLLCGGCYFKGSVQEPTPTAPVGAFADEVRRSFEGSASDAQVLGALHTAIASVIEFDGTRKKPKITDTSMLGEIFAETQRYSRGSETPWSDRFPKLEEVLFNGAVSRDLLEPGKTLPMDETRRKGTVRYFNEIGEILGAIR